MPYLMLLLPTPNGHVFSQNRGADPKICMVHYGQTVSMLWLLLTRYSHLQMPCLMPSSPTLLFLPNRGTELTPYHLHLLVFRQQHMVGFS